MLLVREFGSGWFNSLATFQETQARGIWMPWVGALNPKPCAAECDATEGAGLAAYFAFLNRGPTDAATSEVNAAEVARQEDVSK